MFRGLLLIAIVMIGACAAEPPTPVPGRWQVAGGFIRDPEGRAVIMRGLNLSGEHKQKPYLGFHLPPDYQRLRGWGMSSIRFLLSWAGVQPGPDRYDAQYLDEVARRMDWAQQAGLLVVLDMHQDVFGEGFGGDGAPRWTCDESKYAAHQPASPWFLNYLSPPVMACFDKLWTDPDLGHQFALAWRQVALRLGDHPAVIGFDLINEPHPGSAEPGQFERERLQPFYEKVIGEVRSVAPAWLAFVEPSLTRNLGISTALRPFQAQDIVYAPHSYDAQAEQGQGFDAARRAQVLQNLELLADEAKELGAALWVGEYGGIAEHPGIAAYMDAQYDGAAAVGASSMYWEYTRGPGYGLLAEDGSEKAELLRALVRPYPARVAGSAISFAFDETSRRFTVTYQPDPTITAPTEIIIPERVYPQGYQVQCGGCAFEKLPGVLRIAAAPALQQPAQIIVQP